MHARTFLTGGVLGLSMTLVLACGSAPNESAAPPEQTAAALPGSVTYQLDPNVAKLYPNASWLPAPYQPKYPSVGQSIQMFTEQSLKRDGINYWSVSASDSGLVKITGDDARLTHYSKMHPAFTNAAHAMQGLNGVTLCQQTSGCWDPHPRAGQPWAFFLPLGMALVNQKAVTFLDYPPAASLLAGDYLNNFTMIRWSRVLQAVGVTDPLLYETIVDTRPIAAPGTGQESYLPDATAYFNAQNTDHFYITPMLALLTDPPSNANAGSSLPVIVLGSPAQEAWGKIVGASVKSLSVGSTTLPGASKTTAWVAGNHPDVTTYQCCSGDKNSRCYDTSSNSWSWALIADEQIDLQVACIIRSLAENQSLSPSSAAQACNAAWGGDPVKLPPANARTLCIQAKLDNQDPDAQCKTAQEAEAYCAAHDNNACFDLTCSATPASARIPDPVVSGKGSGNGGR